MVRWDDRCFSLCKPGDASLIGDSSRDLKEDGHILGYIEELHGQTPNARRKHGIFK